MGAALTPNRAVVAIYNNTRHLLVLWDDQEREYKPIVFDDLTRYVEADPQVLADMIEERLRALFNDMITNVDSDGEMSFEIGIDVNPAVIIAHVQLTDDKMFRLGTMAGARHVAKPSLKADRDTVGPSFPKVGFVLPREIQWGQTDAGWTIGRQAQWIDDPVLAMP